MHRVIAQFQSNIVRVRALGGLYEALNHLTTPAVETTDMLRAQVVMAVSALDHYIHAVTLTGMLEIYAGTRVPTPAYLKFEIPINMAVMGVKSGVPAWLDSVIREKHGFLAFQQPDKISGAVRLFSRCELWPTVAASMGITTEEVKAHLQLVVDRRNKIAHEADLDPSYPGSRWPITPRDASGVVDFIETVCQHIHAAVV